MALRTIYLAGGCFWGTERYLSLIPGVVSTAVGYANGRTERPTYEQVCRGGTGHAETVKVEYDDTQVSLTFLLERFFESIDPTALNRQGADVGEQYRTGVYYSDPMDQDIVLGALQMLREGTRGEVVVEALPLDSFWDAEDYHQRYLIKNPGGYCHIRPGLFEAAKAAVDKDTLYRAKDKAALRDTLTPMQYEVTQNAATEPPFQNAYHDTFRPGIYVDITTGEPLFAARDKFDAGCGWPSFIKPIAPGIVDELPDLSHGRVRVEVRAKRGDIHLGHVFEDGPADKGGLRYCINSAALRFVPLEDMQAQGYGAYMEMAEA